MTESECRLDEFLTDPTSHSFTVCGLRKAGVDSALTVSIGSGEVRDGHLWPAFRVMVDGVTVDEGAHWPVPVGLPTDDEQAALTLLAWVSLQAADHAPYNTAVLAVWVAARRDS